MLLPAIYVHQKQWSIVDYIRMYIQLFSVATPLYVFPSQHTHTHRLLPTTIWFNPLVQQLQEDTTALAL